ncbi:hypothetical protein BDC45DRAFT_130719 [Circinella umbellata]|nr:hypothetical protein BDC45DRAFT_130719 [Circinella umbellata]
MGIIQSSTSCKEDQEHKAREVALKSFKDKQALKKQQKLDKKKRQQQQQLEQQYKHHHSSSTTTNNSYGSQQHVAEQQIRPLPTPPSSHHQHRPARRLSYSTDSISSGKSSNNTHQSSGKSGSSFHDMTLEERLNLLNLTGVRGSPSAEKSAYSRLNFVGDEQEINRQLRYVRDRVFLFNLYF